MAHPASLLLRQRPDARLAQGAQPPWRVAVVSVGWQMVEEHVVRVALQHKFPGPPSWDVVAPLEKRALEQHLCASVQV